MEVQVSVRIKIRLAEPGDAGELLQIYAPYILNTSVSFETEVPAVSEFAERIAETGSRYPYLVCLDDNRIIGYEYATKHNVRKSYRFDANLSLYLHPHYHGTGIAYHFYDCLLDILQKLGYFNLYAIIAMPNEKSIRFHEKFAFNHIGTCRQSGFKLGGWHDVVWMDKRINEMPNACTEPAEPLLIGELPVEYLEGVFRKYASRIESATG